jgi:pilus assembly protein Flp/PilA
MMIKKILTGERGQGLVEYALILVLVAIVVMVILALLGPAIGNVFSNIVAAIENPGGGGVQVVDGPHYNPPSGPGGGTVTMTVHVGSGTHSISLASGSGSVSPSSATGPANVNITVSDASEHGSVKIGSSTVSW